MEIQEVPKLELLWKELAAAERKLRVAVMATSRFAHTRRVNTLGVMVKSFDAVLEKVAVRALYNLRLTDFIDTFGEQVGFPCEVVERVSSNNPRFTIPRTRKMKSKKQLIKFVKRMLFLGRRIVILPDVRGKTKVMWV